MNSAIDPLKRELRSLPMVLAPVVSAAMPSRGRNRVDT